MKHIACRQPYSWGQICDPRSANVICISVSQEKKAWKEEIDDITEDDVG